MVGYGVVDVKREGITVNKEWYLLLLVGLCFENEQVMIRESFLAKNPRFL